MRNRFTDLHLVLQAVMGWANSHLHSFTIDGKRCLQPDAGWPDSDFFDERGLSLVDCVAASEFVYEYDFGDSWWHPALGRARRIDHGTRRPQLSLPDT